MRNVVYRRERPLSTPVFSNGFRPVHMLKCIFRKLRLRTGKSFVKESKYRKSFDTDIRDSVVIHEIVDNYTPTFLAEKSQKLKLQTVDDTSKAVEKVICRWPTELYAQVCISLSCGPSLVGGSSYLATETMSYVTRERNDRAKLRSFDTNINNA